MKRKPAPRSKKIAQSRRRSREWRKQSKNTTLKKKVNVAVGRYVAITSLFLISFTFIFSVLGFRNLTSDYVSAFSSTSYDIRGEDVFGVAYYKVESIDEFPILSQVKVIFYDTKSRQILEFNLDPEFSIEVPGKYGNESLKKVLGLGYSVNNNNLDAGLDLLNLNC